MGNVKDALIEDTLRKLGIGANFKSFNILITCINLVSNDPDCLLGVTKTLYPVVGKMCGCTPGAVEHNIRAASKRAWRLNKDGLSKIARYNLAGPPTASEFIDILSAYIARQTPYADLK
ncbi:MAG: sporulation initiation factor Spo0A C-terminal domain-containing protein [Clostridiaceae bacterium]|nr:sporulation initiation factor Spo0A C-terminal domain-containing protein [Clostridiaceae bacterium]